MYMYMYNLDTQIRSQVLFINNMIRGFHHIRYCSTYFPAWDPIQTVSGWVEMEGEELRAELWRGVDWWLEGSPGA